MVNSFELKRPGSLSVSFTFLRSDGEWDQVQMTLNAIRPEPQSLTNPIYTCEYDIGPNTQRISQSSENEEACEGRDTIYSASRGVTFAENFTSLETLALFHFRNYHTPLTPAWRHVRPCSDIPCSPFTTDNAMARDCVTLITRGYPSRRGASKLTPSLCNPCSFNPPSAHVRLFQFSVCLDANKPQPHTHTDLASVRLAEQWNSKKLTEILILDIAVSDFIYGPKFVNNV
ncbi:hypothetical protein CBL_05550 [Carabus blaptoides fortunei]